MARRYAIVTIFLASDTLVSFNSDDRFSVRFDDKRIRHVQATGSLEEVERIEEKEIF